ncbi:hypothetical protein Tsubulata_051331 [Turnera subulata]|uniref:NAD(P)H-quinone oxidoreductase subunit 5, chloroplastic n=1 Tax=Turnera subulata TaxID=218843 RepID=A0A9Q0JL74_9ROSI|nr:hypothetical protein Tsubulata_051331 [Turnera subulata]
MIYDWSYNRGCIDTFYALSLNENIIKGLVKLTLFFYRRIIDGITNTIGLLSFFLGESIKYVGGGRISSYLLVYFLGSGYDRFDRKEGTVSIFRWGFPRKNRRILLQFLMKNIQAIRIEVKKGIYARHFLYIELKGLGTIPLTRTTENLTPQKNEQKAVELAYFLRVRIEVF